MEKQPLPKKGTEFTGWATFNWGFSHNKVYRTRKLAQQSLLDKGESWSDVKNYMAVVKVKCTVI